MRTAVAIPIDDLDPKGIEALATAVGKPRLDSNVFASDGEFTVEVTKPMQIEFIHHHDAY